MKIVQAVQGELVPFDLVMNKCIRGQGYPFFTKLRSIDDFSDGFMLFKGHCTGAKNLQSYLKGHHMGVLLPFSTPKVNHFFVHLASGPYDISHTLCSLGKIISKMAEQSGPSASAGPQPFLRKFDATRDVAGTFYARADFAKKY